MRGNVTQCPASPAGPACGNVTRAGGCAEGQYARVLLVLGGSSGAGKSAIRRFLVEEGRDLLADLKLTTHDFDEDGVPADADSTWRQQTGEQWLQQAIERQRDRTDLLLAANLPLGEILAAPSAPQVEAIAVCLIDCRDTVRVDRLRAREHASYTDQRIWDFILFAAWQRLHYADPAWMPEVIMGHWPEMEWERWTSWKKGDPRWTAPTFDTSDESVEVSARRVAAWIHERVRLRDEGALPLQCGRW